MKTRTPLLYILVFAATQLLAACSSGGGGSGNSPPPPPPPPANNVPTVSGPVASAAGDSDSAYTISSAELTANASDADGDSLSVSNLAVASGDGRGLTLNADSVDVDPAAYNNLTDGDSEVVEISYDISDGRGGSVATTLEITIAGANDTPTRGTISNVLLSDGQPTAGGYRVGSLYVDDPENDGATFSIVGGADAASFSVSGIDLMIDNGVLNATNQDTYQVTVRATDSGGADFDFDLTVMVYTSPALTVGYYDLLLGAGRAEQEPPITFIGETPVNITDLDGADFSGMDMLFFQNPSSGSIIGPYASQENQDKIAAFVEAGGVFIMHDRHVTTMADYLPGDAGALTQDVGSTRTEFELVEDPSFVSQGPGGTITDTNLESANSLSFGFAAADSTAPGSIGYLSRNESNHWITYAYPVGSGWVIYSSIPLDFYLLAGNPEIMRSTYAPNILAQARSLRRKGTDTDGDGLLDVEEAIYGTAPDNADTDGDGAGDRYEVRHGLDPMDPTDGDNDPDQDGLTNAEEFAAGTLPRTADSDGDGLGDGEEVNDIGTDPLSVDTDDDGLGDGEELDVWGTDPNVADTDTGGTVDGREVLVDGTDPLDPDDDLNTIDIPTTLNDVNGFTWDIQRDGNINNGSNDAYDGGMRLSISNVSFPQFATGSLTLDERQITLGVFETAGLQVKRRIYVPSAQAFVRYLDELVNPTDADIAVEVRIDTNLGSDGNTVIVSTSDGDTAIEPTDTWVVTDDTSDGGGDPSLAHVTRGAGGAVVPVVTAPLGRIAYAYSVTVPANGRAIVMHFDSQNANRATAIASANYIGGLGAGTLDGLSAEDMADVVNFDLMQPAAVSRPALAVMSPVCEADGGCR